MSDLPAAPAVPQRFVLRSELPFRALAVAAGTAVAGALVLVLSSARAWPWPAEVLGAVLLAFAVAVMIAAVLADRRWRQTVTLAQSAVTVSRRRSRQTLAWSEIKQVKLNGDQLLLITAGDVAAEVSNPHGPSERVFNALLTELTARLDADRGYHA